MGHSGAGPMRKDKACAHLLRPQQQRGDGGRIGDLDLQLLCFDGCHLI
jgi:hypothetical protein